MRAGISKWRFHSRNAGRRFEKNANCTAVTLIELLVALAVLSVMALVMMSVTSSVQQIAKRTATQVEQFRSSRRAFDRINQHLSQATLATYYDYVNSSGEPRTKDNAHIFVPTRYARISELRYLQAKASTFVPPRGGEMKGQAVFFQAPVGRASMSALDGREALLNTVGYFIEKGGDSTLRPPTTTSAGIPDQNRFRLFEYIEPTENLAVYTHTSGNATFNGTQWITDSLSNRTNSHLLSENIVALVFHALYPDANGDWQAAVSYSSAPRNQSAQVIEENNLPPSVRISMIAVDEISADRIEKSNLVLIDPETDEELQELETQLSDNRLNYKRFESSVAVGPAKWSAK